MKQEAWHKKFLNLFRKNQESLKEKTLQQEFGDTHNLNKVGVFSMNVDPDTGMVLTPNTLMHIAYMILEGHPEIFSSYIQYINFFMGKGIRSKVKDVDDKIMAIKLKLNLEVRKAVYSYNGCGNVYCQFIKNDIVGDVNKPTFTGKQSRKFRGFSIIRDSSRVFYNMDATTDDNFWLYAIHYTAGQNLQGMTPTFNWIKYAIQQVSNIMRFEYTVKLHRDEIYHLRNPYGRNDYYGFSTLMASYGYSRSLKEIIDNIFRIAKYKAIGRKIVSLGGTKTDEVMVTDPEMVEIERKFMSQQKDILFINKPLDIKDLTYEGQYNSMMDEVDYVRKSIMGSIPTSLTAFAGEDFNNRSLSDNSMMGFFLGLENDRELILNYFNEILGEIWGLKGDLGLYFEDTIVFSGEEDGLVKTEEGEIVVEDESKEGKECFIRLKRNRPTLEEKQKFNKTFKENHKNVNLTEVFLPTVVDLKRINGKKEKIKNMEEVKVTFEDLERERKIFLKENNENGN